MTSKINNEQFIYQQSLSNSNKPGDFLKKRPSHVQDAVNAAFERISERHQTWMYNGSKEYKLLRIPDRKFIDYIASKKKDDIYILDVGAGNGTWGNEVERILIANHSDKNKQFNIISLTGSDELKEGIEKTGNITHYKFSKFKIENINKRLKERGLSIKGNVDAIFSNWTFRHFIDPLGTLRQCFNLLTDQEGILLSSDLIFKANCTRKDDWLNKKTLLNLFSDKNSKTPAKILFSSTTRDDSKKYEFLLLRTSKDSLQLPVTYDDNLLTLPNNLNTDNKKIAAYHYILPEPQLDVGDRFKGLWLRGNKLSRVVFEFLMQNRLLNHDENIDILQNPVGKIKNETANPLEKNVEKEEVRSNEKGRLDEPIMSSRINPLANIKEWLKLGDSIVLFNTEHLLVYCQDKSPDLNKIRVIYSNVDPKLLKPEEWPCIMSIAGYKPINGYFEGGDNDFVGAKFVRNDVLPGDFIDRISKPKEVPHKYFFKID